MRFYERYSLINSRGPENPKQDNTRKTCLVKLLKIASTENFMQTERSQNITYRGTINMNDD